MKVHLRQNSIVCIGFVLVFLSHNAPAFPVCQNDSTSLPYSSKVQTIGTSAPHRSLFGNVSVTPAPTADLEPGVHPRILFDIEGWFELIGRYADPATFDLPGSWSRHMRLLSAQYGPDSTFITSLAEMERNGDTAAYTGEEDLVVLTDTQRERLEPIASAIMNSSEGNYQSFFLCALWTTVQEIAVAEQGPSASFTPRTPEDCILATVAWAKVLLSHRAVNCAGDCPTESSGERAHLWLTQRRFEVSDDWYAASFPMALTFDVFFDRFTESQRRIVRSAIAMFVHKKASWGSTITSDKFSPNANLHPHRIFSNWAMYHSYLYLANLVLEGETEYDAYASAVLTESGESGFNVGLNERFTSLISAYMNHSIYPDGSTFEDGYTYFIALREGGLGLLGAHRRGLNIFDTDRFRGLIHNAAQMLEPWHCGRIIGHSSGGGVLYPAWTSLFRYVYRDGPLSQMIWRHRMGDDFKNNNPCRIQWFQDMMPMTIFGGEHGTVTRASSPEGLGEYLKYFPLSYYSPRRGLLIARSSESENALYIHFDARPDSFFPGHDNADRGGFTYTAYRSTWIDDHWWKANLDSRKHSLLHIDGLAQDEKAPSVRMIKREDNGDELIAAADLTYAYNFQWARNWPGESPLRQFVNIYHADGTLVRELEWFTDAEFGHPVDFGWPADDDGEDLGFKRAQFNTHGDPDVGFKGMWTWRRPYRATPLSWVVRSVILNRVNDATDEDSIGYFVIADSARMSGVPTLNSFESYLILAEDVSVDVENSWCEGNWCRIVLKNAGDAETDIQIVSRGERLSFHTEQYMSEKLYTRVVVRSQQEQEEQIWMVFHTHIAQSERMEVERISSDVLKVVYDGKERYYGMDEATHAAVRTSAPTPSSSASASPSSTPSYSPSASSSHSMSASASVTPSTSTRPSSSASFSVQPSASASASPTPSSSASHSSSPTAIVSASPSISASASPSQTSEKSLSPAPTPSPVPSVFTPPMKPLRLRFGRPYNVGASSFESDLASFLHETTADFQVVFKVFGRSRDGGILMDELSTCSDMTKGMTKIAVYDCGEDSVADVNYELRNCWVVHVSGAEDICREDQTRMARRLMRMKPYFVAVSVETDGIQPAQVQMRHRVRVARRRTRSTRRRIQRSLRDRFQRRRQNSRSRARGRQTRLRRSFS